MRSTKRPRRPVQRYRSLLFPGIALLAVAIFWAAVVPSEKGETKAFEYDSLRLEITGVHDEGGFIHKFDPEEGTTVPIDTYHVYPDSNVTVLEAPLTEGGAPRWELRTAGDGTPGRKLLDLTAGMDPISLSEKGEFKVYDPEREDTALFVIVREEDEEYWK